MIVPGEKERKTHYEVWVVKSGTDPVPRNYRIDLTNYPTFGDALAVAERYSLMFNYTCRVRRVTLVHQDIDVIPEYPTFDQTYQEWR